MHISDLHFCPEHTDWDENAVKTHLVRDLERLEDEHGLKPDIIFVTGDIMFGAKKDCGDPSAQYESASYFLLEIMEKCEVAVENLFLVPGNHDVNIHKI